MITLDLSPDDEIAVQLPSGRTILVPLSPSGLALLGQIIVETKAGERRAGSLAAPFQCQIKGILERMEATPAGAATIAHIAARVPRSIAQPGAAKYPAGLSPSGNTVTIRRIPAGVRALEEEKKVKARAVRARPALADLLADFGAPPRRR